MLTWSFTIHMAKICPIFSPFVAHLNLIAQVYLKYQLRNRITEKNFSTFLLFVCFVACLSKCSLTVQPYNLLDIVMTKHFTGMDVNCGSYLKNYTKSALEQQKLLVSDIDRALQNLFSVRMRLGLFNGNPATLLFGNITANDVCTQDHQSLALEAARNGIVLLKNLNKLLPLRKAETPSLAVIGPNANAFETLLGNYEGPPCKITSALQAFQGYVQNTVYNSGCDNISCGSADIEKAVEIAKGAEYVVLVMGLDQSQEREYRDRDDLLLPGKQQSLIQSVAKVAKNPVVLVLLCGGPVDVSFAKEDPKIGSMLWAGYPGEAGGVALAEIIFGDHNPGEVSLNFSHSSILICS